ncbi:hypothetical protein EB73_02170 [Mycobacterium sp. SWH-M3]|nr:hypothetical protein EB73_02170 [Mycobacterium sp. SWH-M3]
MPEQAMMFAPAGLLLAGAICLVWSTTATGPRHWRRRIATEALWAIAGLLALYNIAMTVYRLCTEPIGRTMIGDSIAVIFVSIVALFTVVGLLGSVGLWARLRLRWGRRQAPPKVMRFEPGGGEWAIAAAELSDAASDLGAPASSVDPLQEFDHPNGTRGHHDR